MKTLNLFILSFLIIAASSNAQNQRNIASKPFKEKKPTIVFVHGLWSDGSCWNDVISVLQTEGYQVISTQNPTSSFEDDVAATKKVLDRTQGPVILVGHSWGGFVITEVGNDPRVEGLVYVAGFAPDAGESPVDLLAMAAPNNLNNYFQINNGFITLSKDGIKNAFAGDLSSKQQIQLYATQTPASQSVFTAKNILPAWKSKPSWYIVAKNDSAINPDLQRLLSKRIKAITLEVESSHVVMISKPMEVLMMIREAAGHKYEKNYSQR